MISSKCNNLINISPVIENDMCIACGACISACPSDSIKPAYDSYRGTHEVRIETPEKCTGCETQTCTKVCPSVNVNYGKYIDEYSGGQPRLGTIQEVYTGFSKTHQFNGVSSSGGVIRAIIEHFLANGVMVISLTEPQSGNYKAGLIEKIEDISKMPGSIYHSIGFTDAIPLLENIKYNCAIIAIPCTLEGIDKYITEVAPHLTKKIEAKIGIICGWMYSDHAWMSFSSFKKINANKVEDVKYRGEDKVGRLKIKTQDKIMSFSRREFSDMPDELDFRASFSGVFNRLRCRVCQNHTNIGADISVGDAWLSRLNDPKEKVSILISRTSIGTKLLKELKELKKVELTAASISDITESQSENLVFGKQAKLFSSYLKAKGKFIPEFSFPENEDKLTKEPKLTELTNSFHFHQELFWRHLVRKGYYKLYRLRVAMKILPKHFKKFVLLKLKRPFS